MLRQKNLLYSEHQGHKLYSLRLVELKPYLYEQPGPIRMPEWLLYFVLMVFSLQSSASTVYMKAELARKKQLKRNQIRTYVCMVTQL